jgi:prepilin-type N-terminal cleavage/methylation domain
MSSKKGFTLIEILVVISIISILSAIAIPRFKGINDKATNAKAAAIGRELFPAAMWSYKRYGSALTPTILANDIKYFTDISLNACEITNSTPKFIKLSYFSEERTYVTEINVDNLSYISKDMVTGSVIE